MGKKIPVFVFITTVSGRWLRSKGITKTTGKEKILTTKKYDFIQDCNGKRIELSKKNKP